MSKRKWIIIGGAGFIGSNTAARLLNLGEEVVVIDNLERNGGTESLGLLQCRGLKHFIRARIENQSEVESFLKLHNDADVIIHLAAQVAVTKSIVNPRRDFMVNCLGTLNILEGIRTHCKNQPILLYSSTNKVYGSLDQMPLIERASRVDINKNNIGISENEPLDFHSPYGCSKGAADQYVRDYSRIYGIKTVVFRQSCIYGTSQHGEEDQGWISWLMHAARSNLPITIYGDGKQVRDALWITDLVDLYLKTVQNISIANTNIFNIGGGEKNTLSILELINWIERKQKKKLNVVFKNARAGDQRYYVSDITRAKKLLDWAPKISLNSGLEELWYSPLRIIETSGLEDNRCEFVISANSTPQQLEE